MSLGDYVLVRSEIGAGQTEVTKIEATKAGRKVIVHAPRSGEYLVEVVTRYDKVVRSSRFRADRVVSIVECPVDRGEEDVAQSEEDVDQPTLTLDRAS